jgi:pseudouridine kinase
MTIPKKQQVLELIRAHPFISQHELAQALQLSRSAVAGYVASLMREKSLLGRAYVLPDEATLQPVVCIGGANVDRHLRTLSALQMATSNPVMQHESFGGVARNIAENLARLGSPVTLLCAVGDDVVGKAILEHGQAIGVDTRASLQITGASSGSYTAVLNDQGDMLVAFSHMELCDALDPGYLKSRQAQRANAVLTVADLNLPKSSVELLLADARRDLSVLIIVAVSQPKMMRLPDHLSGLRLLILNRSELEALAGQPLPTLAEINTACAQLQARGVRDVIVTLGLDGGVYTSGAGFHHLPAPDIKVIDVTGAGDAFAAAVCWSLSRDNEDITTACQHGLRLAAVALQSTETVCTSITPHTLQIESR